MAHLVRNRLSVLLLAGAATAAITAGPALASEASACSGSTQIDPLTRPAEGDGGGRRLSSSSVQIASSTAGVGPF